uniref:Uncharacterized protein n=2 Tax=Oryza sativa subsp. japonica TaxID=39947 RepID=Q10GN1_ORYSJ|nr:hypothetical protein [Oryza sativa Japonica Group]ABF97670.1 hypothetical protein LOC_Os03g42334 [Oryza sativa Japonica Group]
MLCSPLLGDEREENLGLPAAGCDEAAQPPPMHEVCQHRATEPLDHDIELELPQHALQVAHIALAEAEPRGHREQGVVHDVTDEHLAVAAAATANPGGDVHDEGLDGRLLLRRWGVAGREALFFLTWHRGIYVRPCQKIDFRPPRQHRKYPLDDAVSIGKYPRLWDVFPQNFTFMVSLS